MIYIGKSFRTLAKASLVLMTTLWVEAQQTRPIVNLFEGKRGSPAATSPNSPRKRLPFINSNDVASGQAIIENGQVTGVRITSGGHYPVGAAIGVVFSGDGLPGAEGKVRLIERGAGVGSSRTSWLEVEGVHITHPGSGYTTPPTVTFVVIK